MRSLQGLVPFVAQVTAALALSLLLAACGSDDDNTAREAARVLQSIDSLSEPELDDRRAELRVLESFELSSTRVREVRETCVALHRALIEAEDVTEELRRAMETAGEGESAEVEAILARGEAHVETAASLRVDCEREVAALRREVARQPD